VKDIIELHNFLNEINDWQTLCALLGVKMTTINNIISDTAMSHYYKRITCFQSFLNLQGRKCWEQVIKTVCGHPFKNYRLGNKIAKEYHIVLLNGWCS